MYNTQTTYTVKDLCVLMLTVSDNTATNQLIDIVGRNEIQAFLTAQGLTATTFKHKLMITENKGPNLTTAFDMTRLLIKIYEAKLPGADLLKSIMCEQVDRTRIPLYLPNSVEVAHKNGSLPQAVHAVGIVYAKNPFTFCFFSDDQTDKKKTTEVLASCAKLCFDFANSSS